MRIIHHWKAINEYYTTIPFVREFEHLLFKKNSNKFKYPFPEVMRRCEGSRYHTASWRDLLLLWSSRLVLLLLFTHPLWHQWHFFVINDKTMWNNLPLCHLWKHPRHWWSLDVKVKQGLQVMCWNFYLLQVFVKCLPTLLKTSMSTISPPFDVNGKGVAYIYRNFSCGWTYMSNSSWMILWICHKHSLVFLT